MVHQKCVSLFHTFEDVKCRNFAARSHGKVRETLFFHSIQKRREESLATEYEDGVRQQILGGLIADKGGDEQISTANQRREDGSVTKVVTIENLLEDQVTITL